jgi:hypothetical protein
MRTFINMSKYILFLVMFFTGPSISAQSTSYDLTFSSVIANGDLNKMVRSNNLAGYTFGVGYRIPFANNTHTRIHANLFGVKGVVGSGIDNTNRFAFNMGVDLMTEYRGITLYGGLFGMSWRQNIVTATNYLYNNTTSQTSSSPTNTYGGNNLAGNDVKYGGRIGLEYPLSKELMINFNFSQTEFNKVFSPSWYALGFTYRF